MPVCFDIFSGRLYLGPTITPSGSIATNVFAMPAVQTVSASGNVTLSKPAPLNRFVTHRIVFEAGVGAFTGNLILPLADAIAGDVAHVRLTYPASTNPTATIRNATAGGTILATLPSTGSIFTQSFDFTFNGSSWDPDET